MIYLYTANVNPIFDLYDNHRDIFEQRMSLLCPERRKKVEEVKQPKDKARAMGAGLLLQCALQDYLSLSVGNKDCGHREEKELKRIFSFDKEELHKARLQRHLEIAYGEKGKPYLPEFPGLYFSLSHSGDYVALALSCHPVGVDIQEERELSDGLQKKYFTEEENAGGARPFEIFSGKESYIKYTGEGMSRSFTDFSVNFKKKTVTMNHHTVAYVRKYELEGGKYVLCVCDRCKDIVSYAEQYTYSISE